MHHWMATADYPPPPPPISDPHCSKNSADTAQKRRFSAAAAMPFEMRAGVVAVFLWVRGERFVLDSSLNLGDRRKLLYGPNPPPCFETGWLCVSTRVSTSPPKTRGCPFLARKEVKLFLGGMWLRIFIAPPSGEQSYFSCYGNSLVSFVHNSRPPPTRVHYGAAHTFCVLPSNPFLFRAWVPRARCVREQ